MIWQLIGQWIVVGAVVAGMCGMAWYIAGWEAKAYVAAPPRPPGRFAVFMDAFWEWVGVALLWLVFIAAVLVILALVAFAILTADPAPIAPTSVIIFLLVCILVKMDSK